MQKNPTKPTASATGAHTLSASGGALLRVPDVARILNCCTRTVDNLTSSKRLAFVKVGRSVRFKPSAVEAFINSYGVDAA